MLIKITNSTIRLDNQTEGVQVRTQWHDIFKQPKENSYQLRKYPSTDKEQIFLDQEKLRQLTMNRPALKDILNGITQADETILPGGRPEMQEAIKNNEMVNIGVNPISIHYLN